MSKISRFKNPDGYNHYLPNFYTDLQSKVYRGGEEEATQSYITIRRGADDDANKGRRMNANWYKLIKGLVFVKIWCQFVVVDFLNKDIIET
jgi:hypothetical protein